MCVKSEQSTSSKKHLPVLLRIYICAGAAVADHLVVQASNLKPALHDCHDAPRPPWLPKKTVFSQSTRTRRRHPYEGVSACTNGGAGRQMVLLFRVSARCCRLCSLLFILVPGGQGNLLQLSAVPPYATDGAPRSIFAASCLRDSEDTWLGVSRSVLCFERLEVVLQEHLPVFLRVPPAWALPPRSPPAR